MEPTRRAHLLRLAGDSSTTPEELDALVAECLAPIAIHASAADQYDEAIKDHPEEAAILSRLVAAPHAPSSLLLRLAEYFPDVALDNPRFDVDLSSLPWALCLRLLTCDAEPKRLRDAARHEDSMVREAVARHPSAPIDVVAVLARDDNTSVCEIATRLLYDAHGRAAVATLPLAHLVHFTTRLHESDDPPSSFHDEMLADWALAELLARAERTETPDEDLAALAAHREEEIRRRVASNEAAPPEVLARLAYDEETSVRVRIARNPNTPVEVLEALAGDPDFDVNQAVLDNPNPPDILDLVRRAESLIDEAEYIFEGIENERWREDLSEAEVERLLSAGPEIRTVAAALPQLPSEVIERLTYSADAYLRAGAARNIRTEDGALERLAKDPEDLVRRSLTRNARASVRSLEVLANDADVSVRQGVAEHRHAPADLLGRLALDPDTNVRKAATAPRSEL